MTEVILHVYDVTNDESNNMSNAIRQFNKIFKDGIGIGGIFHTAIEVYGNREWSYGFCEEGTGVFSCSPGKNRAYRYREQIVLGTTKLPLFSISNILIELSTEWQGNSYNLLAKNCNHFCEELCKKLGIQMWPGWVNRFAHAGDAVQVVAGSTASWFRQAKTGIVSASKSACHFVSGANSEAGRGPPDSLSSSSNRTLNSQASRFRSLSISSSKSFTSIEDKNQQRLER